MLPDGRHFLFFRSRGEQSAIYVGSLDSKDTHEITQANSQAEITPSGHLLFLRGTTLMAQPFDSGALRAKGRAFQVASDVRIASLKREASFSSARNGLIVYQTGGVGRSALTWFDRSGKPLGIVDDFNLYRDVDLAPGGNAIATARVDPKTLLPDVWVKDLGRGASSLLTKSASLMTWSPDGKRIALSSLARRAICDRCQRLQRAKIAAFRRTRPQLVA